MDGCEPVAYVTHRCAFDKCLAGRASFPRSHLFLHSGPMPETSSNGDSTAQTVPQTVMAEQAGHNVVTKSESTSGLPLVDAAVNHVITPSATTGINDRTISDKSSSQSTIVEAQTDAGAHSSTLAVAAPSAGEATGHVAGSTPAVNTSRTNGSIITTANVPEHRASSGEGVSDDASLQGSLDASVNSDTEGSRGEAGDVKKDGGHHIRTNSIKKPATFSKVSVTRNFLAKSASVAPNSAKAGEKPGASGTSASALLIAKPRLIAKTGASLRDVPKTKLGVENAGGPDASKVWNKNRRVCTRLNIPRMY